MTQTEFLRKLHRIHTLVLQNAQQDNEYWENDTTVFTHEEIEIIRLIFELEEFIEGVLPNA